MNAILDTPWSRAWRSLGANWPRPDAILCVSAHWYIPGTAVTGQPAPPTIHDFGGFPPELFAVQYPAPGSIELAERTAALLGETATIRHDWGLDHGAWSVLVHLYPQADIPVVQVSIDRRLDPAGWYAIGQRLAPLRDAQTLILGSGNIVHNLRDAIPRLGSPLAVTPEWALECDRQVAEALMAGNPAPILGLLETPLGRQGHPTPDHFAPLLYCLGAAGEDPASFPMEGFDAGSLSMRAVRWDAG